MQKSKKLDMAKDSVVAVAATATNTRQQEFGEAIGYY
jgi:hypothetical protein